MNYFGVIEIVSAAVGFFHAYQSSSSSDDAVSNLHPEPFAPKTLCLFASELFARQRRAEQLRRKKKKPKAHMPLDGVKNIVLVRSTPHHLLSDR